MAKLSMAAFLKTKCKPDTDRQASVKVGEKADGLSVKLPKGVHFTTHSIPEVTGLLDKSDDLRGRQQIKKQLASGLPLVTTQPLLVAGSDLAEHIRQHEAIQKSANA